MKLIGHLLQPAFSRDEIDDETTLVEVLARKGRSHMPVVAMNRFERSVWQPNLMGSTERSFN